jgi:hypothetical protein
MTFKPGQSGNPVGRARGMGRNHSRGELLVIRAQDCARADLFLAAVVKNEQALPQNSVAKPPKSARITLLRNNIVSCGATAKPLK